MSAPVTLLEFDSLPLWQGLQDAPGIRHTAPFRLSWDEAGFVRQTTAADLLESVLSAYASDEYRHVTAPPGASRWANRLGEDRVRFVCAHIPDVAHRRILEVGGGSTYVAERLTRDYGASAYTVVDPALKRDLAPPGVRIVADYVTDDLIARNEPDLLCAFHLFEHLPDPVWFLEAVRRAFGDRDARLILVFPDCEPHFRSGNVSAYIHEHMSYFTRDSAVHLFRGAGFDIEAEETAEDNLAFVLRPTQPRGWTAQSPDTIVKNCAATLDSAINAVRTNLVDALAAHPWIAVHGATNGTNTLFHLLALNDLDRIVVFDGDESKSGRYLPALPSIVRHTADPTYADAPAVFISATAYFEEIARFLFDQHGIDRRIVRPLFSVDSHDAASS